MNNHTSAQSSLGPIRNSNKNHSKGSSSSNAAGGTYSRRISRNKEITSIKKIEIVRNYLVQKGTQEFVQARYNQRVLSDYIKEVTEKAQEHVETWLDQYGEKYWVPEDRKRFDPTPVSYRVEKRLKDGYFSGTNNDMNDYHDCFFWFRAGRNDDSHDNLEALLEFIRAFISSAMTICKMLREWELYDKGDRILEEANMPYLSLIHI